MSRIRKGMWGEKREFTRLFGEQIDSKTMAGKTQHELEHLVLPRGLDQKEDGAC